jgi:hypothetical protein
MALTVKLDHAGIAAVLRSAAVAQQVTAAASDIRGRVAAAVDGDVVLDTYVTDRAAASVTIRDVRGRVWQARDGVLTRAAASAGLEVRSR